MLGKSSFVLVLNPRCNYSNLNQQYFLDDLMDHLGSTTGTAVRSVHMFLRLCHPLMKIRKEIKEVSVLLSFRLIDAIVIMSPYF